MKQLSTRKGITVRSRSDGGLNVELSIGGHVVSLSLLNLHEGWKGTSLAVWDAATKKDVIGANDDASAEEVAEVISKVLSDRI